MNKILDALVHKIHVVNRNDQILFISYQSNWLSPRKGFIHITYDAKIVKLSDIMLKSY